VLAAAIVALGLLVVAAAPAGAAPIDDAKTAVQQAQQAADDAAGRYEAAIGRLEELDAQVEALRLQIQAGKAEAAALRALARNRAVEAYTGRDVLDSEPFLVGGDPLDSVRREKLLARTKAREDDSVERLAALTEDLAAQRKELEAATVRQREVLARVDTEQAAVQAQLQTAQQALNALEEQLRKEVEAQRAREIAASVARSAANDNGRDYSGTFVATGIVCPIRGAVSFIDSWGFPRHQGAHQGVDLMSPRGTPNVAVVSGNVTFKAGGTSGNGAYLRGDDGHLYYYFHLDSYEGGARHVAQGEVIGYVGNTGDARYTATHTHFEIHPGGGGAVNPYPSVRAVC
jgi:murein DD-endopeptidase MepM/ murein hydrolase activator NlpD